MAIHIASILDVLNRVKRRAPRIVEPVTRPVVAIDNRNETARADASAWMELRKNYELLDRIFATTHFCIVCLDPEFNFVRVNKAYAEACGHPPEFFAGKNHFELYPGEKIEAIFREVVATGKPITIYANPFEFPDHPEWGVTYWDWSLHPLTGDDGRVEGLLFALLDVTERNRAERGLQRETALARLLESLARVANEAATPEDALKLCLRRLCDFSDWTLGRVATTYELSGDLVDPGASIWHAKDLSRHEAFIRSSEEIRQFPIVGGFVGAVVRNKRSVWISDVNETQGFRRKLDALAGGLFAAFAFPVIVQGNVVAFLEFFADAPRPIDPTLIAASETIAAQLARPIERSRAEKLNAQLAAIVENSNDAIVSRTFDHTILTWNAAAERLFGYAAAEVVGRDISSLILPVDQKSRAEQVQAVLKDGLTAPIYDAVRLSKGGRRIDVSIAASPIKDASGKMIGVSIVYRDISERRRAEVEHAQLAAIVRSSNDAIFSRGNDGTILTWNAAAERMFGWSADEAIGQPVSMLLPPERIRQNGNLIDRAPRTEPASPVQTLHVRKDGVRIQTQVTFSPITDEQGNVIAVSNTVRDITELTRKEEELRTYAARLRELSKRMQEVEEAERHAISRELHDRIGQELSTINLLFGGLTGMLSEESRRAARNQLDDIQGLLKSTVANVRDVMAELRPPVLDDYGLLAALRNILTEFARRSGIAVVLDGEDLDPCLPPIVETAIYRISQEAFNNIARHAHAKNVAVSLKADSGSVVLSIADDGIGFTMDDARHNGKHWGLVTMHERAEGVGIAFHLESAPGAGTRIVLEAERAAT